MEREKNALQATGNLWSLYSEYPALLITSSSIRISDTTLYYLFYFVIDLKEASLYVLNSIFVDPMSVLPPYFLHLGGI